MNSFLQKHFKTIFLSIILLNLVLRFIIYFNTSLIITGVSEEPLKAIGKIAGGQHISLSSGNFLYAISYIGYFCKYFLGNIRYFYLFNSILGMVAAFIISWLVWRVAQSKLATIITIIMLTFYTEFMVFSSVFYTPIINLFLLSSLLLIFYNYYHSEDWFRDLIYIGLSCVVLCLTFYFKPELIFLPLFLLALLLILRRNKQFFRKTLILSAFLGVSTFLFYASGIFISKDPGVLANDFVFFGHTDYGGDLGEGSFVYKENEVRYKTALAKYCTIHNINSPDQSQLNEFQKQEIIKFITKHPGKWVHVQFTKFFRTFGVVPETTSFKVLYTGLLKGNLWLTSVVVVAPVAIIILLFILFFNFSAIKKLLRRDEQPVTSNKQPVTSNQQHFLPVYLLLFVYYLIASVFFGQYQERYRMPLMVVFLIPTLGYFIASFNKIQFLKRSSLILKGVVIILFLSIWSFQAQKALSNKQRLNNALESVNPIKPAV